MIETKAQRHNVRKMHREVKNICSKNWIIIKKKVKVTFTQNNWRKNEQEKINQKNGVTGGNCFHGFA